MRLFSYKLNTDTGFAPNPFFGVLTLATCKPLIRKHKNKGDWIAGFTSKTLCGDEIGQERLIYLMKVTNKIPLTEYYIHTDFQNKIPRLDKEETVYKAGDNIYKFENNNFILINNKNHDQNNQERDLSGQNVLVSDCFYYFGGSPKEIKESIRPKIPLGQSAHGYLTHNIKLAEKFILHVRNNYEVGIHHPPHNWPASDSSWMIK